MPGQIHTSLDGVKFERLRVADLRKLCLEQGIPDNGLKSVLVKRLTTWRRGKQRADTTPSPWVPPTPERLDTGECRAIVVAGAEISDDVSRIVTEKGKRFHMTNNYY